MPKAPKMLGTALVPLIVCSNPLGMAYWCWLETLESASYQGPRFDFPRCQFGWASLPSSSSKK